MQVKAAILGGSSLLGFSSIGTAVLYLHSKEIIWDQIKDDAIPEEKESSDSLWTELKNKRTSGDNVNDENLKKILGNSESPADANALRNWCINAYSLPFKNIFKSPDAKLLSDAKIACILTIKEKLGNALNEEGETDKEKFKKNLETLKNYSETGSDPELDDSLKALKEQETTESKPEENWLKLQNWCKNIYKKGFIGENSQRWKLANKFCKNNQ